jgi:hypothetical protein
MSSYDPWVVVSEFRQQNSVLYNRFRNMTQSFPGLAKLCNNPVLANRIYRSECSKYDNISEALYDLDKLSDNHVLIRFTEVDLCCIFEYHQYLYFITNVSDDIVEYGTNVELYQVVLSGKRQKLVFACTNFDQFDKLQHYAKDCFHVDVSKSNNQLTVNIPLNNESEIADNYNMLYNYIYNRNDITCCDSMKPVPLLQKLDYKYRVYSCNDTLDIRSLEQLLNTIKTIGGSAPVTINITNSFNTVTNDRQSQDRKKK